MIDFDEYTRVYKNLDTCLKTFEDIMQLCRVMSNNEAMVIAKKIADCMDEIQENNNNAKRARNN